MVQETVLQHWIMTKFVLPFLLIFVILYAILEKTKLLGENRQANAIVSFVIGLIFVSVAYPKEIVGNMILFLTVAIVIVFVVLLIWGFVSGGNMKENIFTGAMKWVVLGVVLIAVTIAVLWATGVDTTVTNFLFHQEWSETFWLNFLFIAVIAIAMATMLGKATTGGKG